MNKLLTFVTITGIAIIAIFCIRKLGERKKGTLKIGILQTASHPALDAARAGFMEELARQTKKNITFVVRNAEGNIANAHTIAQRFHNSDLDAIFAIATLAMQAIASVEKNKPIFVAAVTDPYGLGIMDEETNITGVSDMIDVKRTVKLLHQFIPSADRVAIIFNTSEINSVTLAEQMKKELKALKLTPIEFGIISESDLPTAIASALKNADVLLAPTDNMVASAISMIAKLAQDAQKPFIVSDNLLVQKGALMACGVDYKKTGIKAAHIAQKILIEDKKPYEFPIKMLTSSSTIFVNKDVLRQLNLQIPQIYKDQVRLVTTGEGV